MYRTTGARACLRGFKSAKLPPSLRLHVPSSSLNVDYVARASHRRRAEPVWSIVSNKFGVRCFVPDRLTILSRGLTLKSQLVPTLPRSERRKPCSRGRGVCLHSDAGRQGLHGSARPDCTHLLATRLLSSLGTRPIAMTELIS